LGRFRFIFSYLVFPGNGAALASKYYIITLSLPRDARISAFGGQKAEYERKKCPKTSFALCRIHGINESFISRKISVKTFFYVDSVAQETDFTIPA